MTTERRANSVGDPPPSEMALSLGRLSLEYPLYLVCSPFVFIVVPVPSLFILVLHDACTY